MARAKRRLISTQRLACLWITGAICITPTGAMEALNGLPPLDPVILGEARLSDASPLEFGMLPLPSSQSRTYLHKDATAEI